MTNPANVIDTGDEIMESLLNELENNQLVLPTLPEVALKIRDEIDDDSVTASKVASIISTDASLSAKLLQVSNSPLFRAKNPISNIKAAVARLGYKQIRTLVNSLVMKQMFQATSEVLDTRLRDCWQHSSQVAAIAGVIASQTPGLEKDSAVLAGLVHNIGKLPILVHAEAFPKILLNVELLDYIILNLHSRIGEKILSNWEFPQPLVEAVREHDNLQYTHEGGPNYADVVTVSNLQSITNSKHPLAVADWSNVSAFEQLDIDTEIQMVDIEENKEAIAEMKEILIS